MGKTTTYGYNTDTGILEWVQAPNDTEETRTEYAYDPDTFLLETVSATTDTGLAMSADYTYENNLLKSIETPSTVYGFNYGAFGLRQNVQIGTGENPLTLASYDYYEQNYLLESLDYGNGDRVKYTYDKYGRLLAETYEDHDATDDDVPDTVTYLYDNDGVLAAVIDSASGITTRQYYDLSGRSTGYSETADGYSHSVGYEYDESNNLSQLVEDINGTERITSYTYDKDNRTTSITTDGTTVEYTYDSFGRVTQQVTKNGDTVILTEAFTYVANGNNLSSQIASYTTYKGTVADTNLIAQYSYTYDDNGNILTVSDGTNTTRYTYDSANQLTREDNEAAGKTYTWEYDNAGNILSAKTYAYTTGNLGAATSTVPYAYNNDQWGDLLTAYNGQTISYDQIGNPTNDGNRSFTWEHGRQLASLTEGSTTWNYTYNNAGLRTARTNGTTTYKYIYDDSALVQMTVGNQTVSFTYDSGVPLTMKVYTDTEENGTTCDTYYYITNLQGDVMALVDDGGNTVVSYSYTAYGEVTITDYDENDYAEINPLTYRGYVYDVETELFYLQTRYYDPEIGRFINADVLLATGQGLTGNNIFAYCGNNPVNRADPTGLSFKELMETICEIIIKLVNTLINRYYVASGQPTSPVRHEDYHNNYYYGQYGAARDGYSHRGIDFYPSDSTDIERNGGDGTPKDVLAMQDGTVVELRYDFWDTLGGVAIDHGDYVVLYAEIDHNLKIGDKVKQGQVIGQMKKGPNSGTLMLHLEVFIGGYGGWSEHNQYREDPTYIYYLPDWRD